MFSRGHSLAMTAGIRRGLTLTWLFLFVLSILLQYGLATPRSVLAASGLKAGTVQGFEIDGNLKSGDASTNPGTIPAALIDGTLTNGDDWLDGTSGSGVVDPATPPSSTIVHDKFNSNTDDVYGGGAKETDTRTWPAYVTSPVTNKDDVRDAMAYAKFVGNSAFFYAGATRIVNNGDTHIDFELNRKPFKTYSDGVSKPDRTVGDVLVSLEFSNGGSDPIVTVYKVTAVTTYPTGQDTTFSADVATASAVHSATNFADLPDEGLGYAIPSFEFAETSIDLQALGINTGCPGLSSGHIRTRSGGDLASSQLKDNIAPFPIDLNNCGKLIIEKHAGTVDGPLLGGATFTVADDPRPGQTGTYTIKDGDAGDSSATAGRIQIDPADPGTYTVCETVPPTGYKLASPACQSGIVVPPNGTATVKFADPRKTATTTLGVKSANPADGSYITAGQSISLVVTETNTGESTLHNVVVGGTNSCASWTAAANKNGGAGAFSGSLASGESVDFSCSFTAPSSGSFSWSATATGLDELNDAHDPTGETTGGSYDILEPATKLTIITNAAPQVHEGDTVTIVVDEKNDGEGTITAVHVDGTGPCASNWVADASKQGGGAFSGALAPGEHVHFTCTFTAGAADFTWSADGKGTDALGHAVPSTNEHQAGSVDVVSPSTQLTIQSAPTKVEAGSTITIVVRETNTGDGALTNVHVVAGGDCASFSPANVPTLASGAHADFTCSITTTAGDGTDVSWTADGKGTDSLGSAAPDTGEHAEGTVEVIAPATELTLVSAPTKVEHGAEVTITVRETNTGDDALSGVNVTGTNSCATWAPVDAGFNGNLAVGAHEDFTCTFTVGTSDVHWTALGHGTDSLLNAAPAAGEDEAGDIDVINPATTLTLVSETPDPVVAHGSTKIIVRETNTGDSSLSNVNVTGSPCATWTPVDAGFDGTLAAGEHEDFSCTVADVGTTNVVWSALGHGTDELENAAPLDNEDESGSVHVVNPSIDVVKTAGSSLGSQAADGTVYETQDGTSVVYKYVVTTQDQDGLTDVQVSDDLCSPVTAVETGGHNSGDTNGNDTLEPGESWVFSCTSSLTIADDGKHVHNIATASGQPLVGGRVSDQDDANVTLLTPDIAIVKTAGDAADGETYVTEAFADNVTYHYAVTNTGEIDLVGVTVVDDNGTPGDAGDDFTVCTIATLAVGDTKTCDKTLTVSADTTNVATATGHTAQKPGDEVSDTDDAVVRVPDVSISKTNDDEDGIVGHGQTVTYTIDVSVFSGPVTNAVVTDTLPAGQTYVVGSQTSSPSATFQVLDGGKTLKWTWSSLATNAHITYQVTIDSDAVLGSQTNLATICVSELKACKPSDSTVDVPELTIDKSYTGNTGGTVEGVRISKVGDNLTFSLAYDLSGGPVHNGVITDTLPEGVTYVVGSATNSDEFTFVGYDSATRTLTWNADVVSKDGTVSYHVTVDSDAFELDQPLENVATIDSDETDTSQDTEHVFVQFVEQATATPHVTLPPTDGMSDPGTPSGPDAGLTSILLILTGIALLASYVAPMSGRLRRRQVVVRSRRDD